MNKRIRVLFIILLPILVLFLMWSVNKYQNEKQLAEDLAKRFDTTMKCSYQMLLVTLTALYNIAEVYEINAQKAYNYSPTDYKEVFRQLNIDYLNNESGKINTEKLYMYYCFRSSLAYGHLIHGGKYREEEVKAFNKIEYVYQELEFQPNMEYEELILNLHRTKILLNESLETIKKYKNNDYNYNSWRFPETSSKDIFGRYHSRENWPFNIFRD